MDPHGYTQVFPVHGSNDTQRYSMVAYTLINVFPLCLFCNSFRCQFICNSLQVIWVGIAIAEMRYKTTADYILTCVSFISCISNTKFWVIFHQRESVVINQLMIYTLLFSFLSLSFYHCNLLPDEINGLCNVFIKQNTQISVLFSCLVKLVWMVDSWMVNNV